MNNGFKILLHPGFFKAAAAISFDFETSAQSPGHSFKSRLKTRYLEYRNRFASQKRDLSGRCGRGYAGRLGAEKIWKLFQELNLHGTWFSTGHVLLKHNLKKNAFRINQKLPYAVQSAGFTRATTWRRNSNSFYHEPFSDYQNYPWYYLGDLAERLRDNGEDIQNHSFSHPYVALEPATNVRIDLEDWQRVARNNGFEPARVFAFPFQGDYYFENQKLNSRLIHSENQIQAEFRSVELSEEHLQILKENGIELLTRCGSKHSSPMMEDFSEYQGSGLFFMKDKGLMGFRAAERFSSFLDALIANGSTIDLWLHPNDVYFEGDYLRFKKLLTELIARHNSIWVTTIADLWSRFKLIQQCQLKIEEDKEGVTLKIQNFGSKIIEDLALQIPDNFILQHQQFNYDSRAGRIIVKKISPKEKVNIKLEKRF